MTQLNTLSKHLQESACGDSGKYGESSLNHSVCVQINKSIAISKQLGCRGLAQQFMSIVTACMSKMGLTSRSLQEYFSDFVQLSVGDRVKATAGRHNKRRRGTVVVQASNEVDSLVQVRL